ncbi:hypothetical protein MMF93_23815 [Streptomyces tubbatahanensis]|uniref:Uncharacterized protein n=1 Tax=Streptomyces tubbatahanensis TaxID=2923272 RepID=A0ABY3XYT2_9ACTN|nr:hypothetical protein [Streptomyces tubbatahanensis]UNS99153.1 hypothetical protein MMF93_23815 [Streptomyces tubbatahanensis]
MTSEISGGTDGIGRGGRVAAVGTDRAKAESGARFQRPRRTKTADGPASDSAPTCRSRSPLSHGLPSHGLPSHGQLSHGRLSHGPAGLLGRAAHPVVTAFGGAGRFETAVKELPAFQASSLADARRLYGRTREVLAR